MTNLPEIYEILEKIRASSRNTLFRARDRLDKRTVILKMMNQGLANREDRARFRREYDILRHLPPDSLNPFRNWSP
jgi:serine/threonine protein kinase